MKTVKRIKTAVNSLKDWGEVDQSLLELGHLTREKQRITDRYDKKIEQLKAECSEALDGILAAMEEEFEKSHLFTVGHMEELDGRRKALTHGAVAFRKSTELKLPRDEAGVISALKKLGKEACIDVIEKVKKVLLRKEDEAVIAAVGGRLVEKDNFRVELPEVNYEYDQKLKVVK